jgi:hypothetical protein
MKKEIALVPTEIIENKIYLIRGIKVMLDSDLAKLYGVPTFRLNEAVKRNRERFPVDFMFQLQREEFVNLRSQIAIPSYGGRRYVPYVFTEQGQHIANIFNVIKQLIDPPPPKVPKEPMGFRDREKD